MFLDKKLYTLGCGKWRGQISRKEKGKHAMSKNRDSDTLNYITVILGFGLCRAWIVLCLMIPLLSNVSPTKVSHAPYWLYLAAGVLTALFVVFAVRRLRNKAQIIHRILYGACAFLLVLAAILIPLTLSQQLEFLALSGFVIGGAGAGLLQVLWGEQFAKHEIRFATIVSPAAALVTAVLVALTSAEASLVGYIVFPLLSFVLLVYKAGRSGLKVTELFWLPKSLFLLKPSLLDGSGSGQILSDTAADKVYAKTADKAYAKAADKTGNMTVDKAADKAYAKAADSTEKITDKTDDKAKRSLVIKVGKLMFSIMTFSFLCRLFDTLPQNGSNPFAFFGGSALLALAIVGLSFLALSAILKQRFNPTSTYRLSLPIMVAGFVAIALFFDTHAALCILLINIGYEFFDILVWILFTETARRKGENPLRIFGLGVAFMFIGMALGYFIGDVLNSYIASGSIQITVVAMLCILSLVVLAFLVIPEGTIDQLLDTVRSDKKSEVGLRTQASSLDSKLEANCTLVASAYGLTPRESEVLLLLAYGRTLSIIARDLFVAKGTARSHMESIYRKLGVHKQQELIDLVERYEAL
jgi:DNA-binding CsgD family transcriptional regulator